ncbi:MAG: tyrosine-type recombinase/integrase [Chloroflexi bacterium]|nr:tyrosine-type recombinase/integrase [Chloroflexota bacterium]
MTHGIPTTPHEMFLLDRRIANNSPKTLQWLMDSISDFHRFCEDASRPRSEVAVEWRPGHRKTPPAPVPPKQIRPELIKAWMVANQERQCSKSTVNGRFRAFRLYCKWLVEKKYVKKNPMEGIPTPKLGKTIPVIWSDVELQDILKLCPPNVWWGARDGAMILAYCYTGLRLSELITLEEANISLRQGLIKVVGKGDKERWVPLKPVVVQAMLNYTRFRNVNEKAFWQTKDGGPMKVNTWHLIMSRLKKTAGTQGRRKGTHAMRHTFAAEFLDAGGNLANLQTILGHENLKSTEIYLRARKPTSAMKDYQRLDLYGGGEAAPTHGR